MSSRNNTARLTFTAIRRAYRSACRLPLASGTVADGQATIRARVTALAALRNYCNHWDTFEPPTRWHLGSPRRTSRGLTVYRFEVTNTARAFFRRTAGTV